MLAIAVKVTGRPAGRLTPIPELLSVGQSQYSTLQPVALCKPKSNEKEPRKNMNETAEVCRILNVKNVFQ